MSDDLLFGNRAGYLLTGEWLGPFNEWTLVKGPFYPIWLAMTVSLRLQPSLSQHLLYILACYIFTISVRPIVQKPIWQFILFVILLFNPMSYSNFTYRLLREQIYPALTILVLSGVFGLMIRYNRSLKSMVLWSMYLGLTLSAFWLTREEGVWIFPSLLIVMSVTAIRIYRTKFANRTWRLAILVLPFVVFLISMLTVAAINKSYYGIFSTNELKSSNFLNAYGALTRVKHTEWHPMIPVPRETRERLYESIPSFAELKQYLEDYKNGGFPYAMIISGCLDASVCYDYTGGFFIWAFRDAVSEAGYYQSIVSSQLYFQRLASEINAACYEKKLDCGPARSSLISPWHSDYTWPLLNTFSHAIFYLTEFKGVDTSYLNIEPELRVTYIYGSNFLLKADEKVSILNWFGSAYQLIMPILLILSLLSYIGSTLFTFRKRKLTDFYIINSVIIMAICSRLFILSLITVSSFSAITPQYLSPVYPLVLILSILSLLDSKQVFSNKDG